MKTGEIHDTSLHKFKLQENVLSLKSEFGTGVRLRRTKAGPTAPFPIYVTISIETPEKYSQYDLDALTFQVEISEAEGASFAYDISVLNDHLPSVLKQKISEYLLKYLETECGGSASRTSCSCVIMSGTLVLEPSSTLFMRFWSRMSQ
eukprot:jgi/Picre1/27320/NNA_000289.t1